MHAAVVTAFDRPPEYVEIEEPRADGPEQEVVDVVAAALHPRVRSQADGSHYTSDGELPMVPGIDGVGRRADGSLVYFVLPDTRWGSMAERVAIDLRRSIPLPDAATDPIAIAAALNPAMSSWLALRRRARLQAGQSVLVLGATGSAGRLAVQLATRLGAARVIAAGRDARTLDELAAFGARVVSLAGDEREAAARVGAAAAEVDVVVDYLWGRPAELVLPALLTARPDRGIHLDWVQVGAVAGAEISLPSALLRQADVAMLGSGQGSISTRGILDELVPLTEEITAGGLLLDTVVRPLSEVTAVWTEPGDARRRTVLVPER